MGFHGTSGPRTPGSTRGFPGDYINFPAMYVECILAFYLELLIWYGFTVYILRTFLLMNSSVESVVMN